MNASIKTLLKQIKSGRLETDKARILDFIINNYGCTTQDVEEQLELKHQTASARITNLLDLGVVEEIGMLEKEAAAYSRLGYQPKVKKQEENAKTRKKEKYRKWIKKGITHFEDFINPELRFQLECKG